jgi:uncharacterized protein YdeI (YjbR/CyaY-like superfamily)
VAEYHNEMLGMSKSDYLPTTYAKNRSEWRKWLEKHATSSGVWLIYYKKASGKPSVSYDEAVEEALCFGWIDSRVNALDEQRYTQFFSPRKPKSSWSKLNKQRVEQLIQNGLMTAAGLEKIETAKRDGSWNSLDAIEDLQLSPDLMAALDSNKTASENFMAFSTSVKKNIVRWIESAKRPETRLQRIAETVTLAAQNIKAYPYRK